MCWVRLNEQCAVVGCCDCFRFFFLAILLLLFLRLLALYLLAYVVPCRDVSCVFFSSHLQWMSSYDSIWIEEKTRRRKKTMAMLRAWFLTPPQTKWNEREREKMRDERKHITTIVSYELDWLTRAKRNKYTHTTIHKIVFGTLSPFSFMWSFVFLYQQQITI